MDYLIGSLLTIIVVYFIVKSMASTIVSSTASFKIRYSQTHMHSLIKPLLPPLNQIKKLNVKPKQSTKHVDKTHIKVIILEDNAYWTKDNVLYTAEIVNGEIDKALTRVVDIMGMDKVELDKMLFIVDKLRDGKNDDSSSTSN